MKSGHRPYAKVVSAKRCCSVCVRLPLPQATGQKVYLCTAIPGCVGFSADHRLELLFELLEKFLIARPLIRLGQELAVGLQMGQGELGRQFAQVDCTRRIDCRHASHVRQHVTHDEIHFGSAQRCLHLPQYLLIAEVALNELDVVHALHFQQVDGHNFAAGAGTSAPVVGEPQSGGRGKVLGGSSAVNGMVYMRGMREDFDAWAAECPGWSFDDVLPYFMKSEDLDGPPSPVHGRGGALAVSTGRARHHLTEVFVDACDEIGFPRRTEYCGGDQSGSFFLYSTMNRRGLRADTYTSFLRRAMKRPNLEVRTGLMATRLAPQDERV